MSQAGAGDPVAVDQQAFVLVTQPRRALFGGAELSDIAAGGDFCCLAAGFQFFHGQSQCARDGAGVFGALTVAVLKRADGADFDARQFRKLCQGELQVRPVVLDV